MRVIHVAPTPFGSEGLFGGGERYPLELARAVSRHVPCELVTFGRRGGVRTERGGLRIRTLPSLGRVAGHPAHPVPMGLRRVTHGADVVHVHHMRALPSRLAAAWAKGAGRRSVVTDHGLLGPGRGRSLHPLFDAFLLVSRHSADLLDAPPDRVRVVFGGADAERYRPDPAVERRGVLFVGRLTPHKGVDRLIRAVPDDVRLLVAGSTGHDRRPPERDYPRLLERLASDKDVRFLGPVSDAELPALYRRAAVVAVPSVDRTCYGASVEVSELLGLVALEAMASGTPVVASRIGGLAEIVEDGETGYLVEPGDVGALRGRIAALVADRRLARRLGDRARERFLERFTWDRCARRCIDAYTNLAAPGA